MERKREKKEKDGDRKGDRKEREILYLLVHFLEQSHQQVQARQNSAVWNSVQISSGVIGPQVLWPFSTAFLGTLEGNRIES